MPLKYASQFSEQFWGLFTIQNYTPLKRIKAWVCLALACLPYKITHLSNLHHIFVLKIEACLPYKITHLSNQHTRPIKHIAACLPYKITHLSNHDKEVLIMARGLFTIQNYTPLKLIYHLLNCKNCLTIIKNYTPLKLLSMRYPCVVVWQPYKITHLSNLLASQMHRTYVWQP